MPRRRVAAIQSTVRPRRTRIATRSTAIGMTRYRPYRLGSLKSDVTRKNDVYAFATSRSRAKKSVRVCACQIPIAANSVPSATSVTRSARGSQPASGARATTASPATNGKTKNASAIAPARSSQVHRNDVAVSVTNAASGSERRKGGGGGRSPRTIRYASASTDAAMTRYSGSSRNASSLPSSTGTRNGAAARSATGVAAG